MGTVLDEVVGPDMVRPLRSEPDTGSVIEPEPALLRLLVRNLQPFAPPDPFHPLVIDMPARGVEQPCDHAIAVAPVLAGQLDDVIGQAVFVPASLWNLALGGAVLFQGAAGPALGDTEGLPHMVNAAAAARRAQKFPRAASAKISLSSVRSETARRSRWFSCSRSFSRFS